jgi:hypothetical protein
MVPNRLPDLAACSVPLDQTVALDWLRYSLGQGEVISPHALSVVEGREGHTFTLAPEQIDPALLADPTSGGVVWGVRAWEALTDVLDELARRGAACVVVEEDLARRGDPAALVEGITGGYVGDRVLHWSSLADGSQRALAAIRVPSGYPTNAFLSSATDVDLGLVPGADLPDDIGSRVARTLVAVIVAAYDDETYMVWQPRGDLGAA